MDYTTTELSEQEIADVTKELQEVLAKYNCEMQVISNIHILKRVPVEVAEKVEVIKSPYDGAGSTPETDTTSEEGGGNGNTEPTKE